MNTLLLVEHDGTTLLPGTRKALSAALKLGGPVDLLVSGSGIGSVAEAAAGLAGVQRVLVADTPVLAGQLAEPMTRLLTSLAADYGAFVAAAGTTGKNIMPRLAAKLDVMQVSEIIDVVSPGTFRRPIYAGNAVETVRTNEAKLVLTVRASAFDPASDSGRRAPLHDLSLPVPGNMPEFVELIATGGSRPDLGSARIVVSGGRAMNSPENFRDVLGPLADALGAALGASRAAVDAGYAPNDWQVGQTGKIVGPELYIAVGISGAIQHLAGIKDARIIVAINKDPDAPIFDVADYGLVGDLFDIVPQLAALVRS